MPIFIPISANIIWCKCVITNIILTRQLKICHRFYSTELKNQNDKTGFELYKVEHITGINPEAILLGVDRYDRALCPGLQPGPPSQTPGGLGQRYWSVSTVTWLPKLELRRSGSSGPSSAMRVFCAGHVLSNHIRHQSHDMHEKLMVSYIFVTKNV